MPRARRPAVVGQAFAQKLTRRQVDAHTRRSLFRILPRPALDLGAGFRQAPVANGKDHPALFNKRNELHGEDKAAFRMVPANERFEADDPARGKVRFRLVIELELSRFQPAAKIGTLWPVVPPCLPGKRRSCVAVLLFSQQPKLKLRGDHLGLNLSSAGVPREPGVAEGSRRRCSGFRESHRLMIGLGR